MNFLLNGNLQYDSDEREEDSDDSDDDRRPSPAPSLIPSVSDHAEMNGNESSLACYRKYHVEVSFKIQDLGDAFSGGKRVIPSPCPSTLSDEEWQLYWRTDDKGPLFVGFKWGDTPTGAVKHWSKYQLECSRGQPQSGHKVRIRTMSSTPDKGVLPPPRVVQVELFSPGMVSEGEIVKVVWSIYFNNLDHNKILRDLPLRAGYTGPFLCSLLSG